MAENVLDIRGLRVSFFTEEGEVRAVDDVRLSIPRGRIVALVGESGSGKSVTAYSILGLVQRPGRVVGGEILFTGRDGDTVDLARLGGSSEALRRIRGARIGMIFQEPMTALSPVHTVADQLCEALLVHGEASRKAAEDKATAMLARVGIPAPERRMRQYPFELSGGMRQRIVIAMAMLANPELLIADEPTTALDVTIQAQVLALMNELQREAGNSILLITHDLGVVAQVADHVAVMYVGRVVETGPVRDVMKRPRHPYTAGLIESLPGLHREHERLPSIQGSVPNLTELPPGCAFHPRCPHHKPGACDATARPVLADTGPDRQSACLRARELWGDT